MDKNSDLSPEQRKTPSPAIRNLLKRKAPGAWTSEGVPLPEPIKQALDFAERLEEGRKRERTEDGPSPA